MSWPVRKRRRPHRASSLARRMLDASIHRVIVVDEDNHPIGIVSSTDIMAAVAHRS
jgi:CBS-domain-containing membrane protein